MATAVAHTAKTPKTSANVAHAAAGEQLGQFDRLPVAHVVTPAIGRHHKAVGERRGRCYGHHLRPTMLPCKRNRPHALKKRMQRKWQ